MFPRPRRATAERRFVDRRLLPSRSGSRKGLAETDLFGIVLFLLLFLLPDASPVRSYYVSFEHKTFARKT